MQGDEATGAQIAPNRQTDQHRECLMKWSSNLKKFRRVVAVGAVLAASLGVTLPVKAQTVEEIKKKGQLTVGMLVDFPPFGITSLEGQPDGFDADIAKALAKHLGVK